MNFEFLEKIKGYLDRDQIDLAKHLVNEALKTQLFELYLAGQLEQKTPGNTKPKVTPAPTKSVAKIAPKAPVSALELSLPEKQPPQPSAFDLVKTQSAKDREAVSVQYELIKKKRKEELEELVASTTSSDIKSSSKPELENYNIDFKRLKRAVNRHLKSKTKKRLRLDVGISQKALDDIISANEPKFYSKTLDKLVDYFGHEILAGEATTC